MTPAPPLPASATLTDELVCMGASLSAARAGFFELDQVRAACAGV
jgi:hypothetical protein